MRESRREEKRLIEEGGRPVSRAKRDSKSYSKRGQVEMFIFKVSLNEERKVSDRTSDKG